MSQLNLRTLLSGDTISQVVDKLNYNFQQIVLNGGGPMGDPGYIGPPGIPGPEGPLGPVGPTGATGTYVFAGLTAPNTTSPTVPTPRIGDIYIQAASGTITFWEKTITGATGWEFVDSINAADSVFTTAESSFIATPETTAAYPRLDKASLFLVSDFASLTAPNQILDYSDPINPKIHGWLDQTWVPWQSLFGGLYNQIRILNTDPDITGSGVTTRNDQGAGMLISLQTVPGNSPMQVLSISSADNSPTNDKYFYIAPNQGTTAPIFTNNLDRVAINASKDPNDARNNDLLDNLTVFGSQLIYDDNNSFLKIDTQDGGSGISSLIISKGNEFGAGSNNGEWSFEIGTLGTSNYSLNLQGVNTGRTNPSVMNFDISLLDDRGEITPQISIGSTNAIAQLEIGRYVAGRQGFGQINLATTTSNAAGYSSFNLFRNENASWTSRGNSTYNGGSINWASADGKTVSWLLMPSSGGADATYSNDGFLETLSSISMKRISGGSAKLLIDSFAYGNLGDSIVGNAPNLIIGLANTTTPATFNFGNDASGIGLHGSGKSIEWLAYQNPSGSSSTGFKLTTASASAGGSTLTTQKFQYRSYLDVAWKNAITILSQDDAAGGTYSGNVIIGNVNPSTTIGKAKLTVVGASGPIDSSVSGSFLGSPQIVDFQTSTGNSAFTLDKNGNVVSGIRFGNVNYESSDSYTLDHYEEGSWTPILNPEGVSNIIGWDSSVYKIYKANYTRVGDKVKVDFTIKVDGLTGPLGGTGSRNMYISGFPYKPDFERVSIGAVNDPLNPSYPLVALKSVGISDNGVGAVGQVVAFAGSAMPAGWILCDGASYSRTLYKDLFTQIGTIYGSDNSSTFKVPDLRGYFVRGLGGVDPDGSFRGIGSTQEDANKQHSHYVQTGGDNKVDDNSGYIQGRNNADGRLDPSVADPRTLNNYTGSYISHYTTSSGESESRPKNVAMNYIIYAGNSGSSGAIGDLAGGFVLSNNVTPRLYLYNSIGNLSLNNLPSSSGTFSSLFGSFEYFISSVKSVPFVTSMTYNYTIGATAFNIPLMPLIATDSPITGIAVSGLPGWMTFNYLTSSLEFASGVTTVPGPTQSNPITLTATNAAGPGSGIITVAAFAIAPPVVTGPTVIDISEGTPGSFQFVATNSPVNWGVNYSGGGCIIGSANLPTGASFSFSGATATLSFDNTYTIAFDGETYQICASNAGGVGSVNTVTNVTLPFTSELNWEYTYLVDSTIYGGWTLEVYDVASGGTPMTTANLSADIGNGNTTSGAFPVSGLIDGETYYIEGQVIWGSYSGVFSIYSKVYEDLGNTSYIDQPRSQGYKTSTRMPFVYNSTIPNTIKIELIGT